MAETKGRQKRENTTAVGEPVGEPVGVQSLRAVRWLIDFRTDALVDMYFRVFSFPPFFFLAFRSPTFQNRAGPEQEAALRERCDVATWRWDDRTYQVTIPVSS